MEEIKTELDLLIKTFSFIKFAFNAPRYNLRIWINENPSDSTDFYFWYNDHQEWCIYSVIDTKNFKEFLYKFIWGLIKCELY